MDIKKLILGIILVIITVIVIFLLVGNLAPELVNAGNNVSQFSSNVTGSVQTLPLQSLFAPSGIVFLILMIGVFLLVIFLVLKRMGKTE